ncbi:MAG TPA: SUMF1/EgtB/PvdO family nonheme iron enzyme [Polyangiaceae bacterium]|nr:SUMF1/EgtB/PvdO family nonheme iron enzyme [Polyangiaceae bacterium]
MRSTSRGSLPRAAGLVALALVVGVPVRRALRAATPDQAPLASRAQVAAALEALAAAFRGHERRLASGAPGTIERAISAYAPGVFRPVQEGVIAPVTPGARCPPDMGLVLDVVCVDRYEASVVERAPDGALLPHAPNQPLATGAVYVARSVPGVIPQAYVSGAQALEACRRAGKRLCAPVEWRAACGGSQGYAFPYGPVRVPGRCHDSGVNPMLAYHADAQARGWGAVELNDPRNIELDGTVAKTGAFPECVNDFGLHDMVGNVHEWTADPNGTFQGGYWLDTSLHGEGCAYRTIGHPFDYRDYSTGFRCCADPQSAQGTRPGAAERDAHGP